MIAKKFSGSPGDELGSKDQRSQQPYHGGGLKEREMLRDVEAASWPLLPTVLLSVAQDDGDH
jgi:hypothetical protein